MHELLFLDYNPFLASSLKRENRRSLQSLIQNFKPMAHGRWLVQWKEMTNKAFTRLTLEDYIYFTLLGSRKRMLPDVRIGHLEA